MLAALTQAGFAGAEARVGHPCAGVIEVAVTSGDPASLREVLETHAGPSDLLVSAHDIDLPKVFVSDMDSTMIGQECIDELADFAGLKDHVSAITERAMRGELDFAAALAERVALLAGLGEETIQHCLTERITLMSEGKTLVATLKSLGCRTVLVTGGFHHFADPVAQMLGFDRVVANRLAVAGGKLSGTVTGPIVDSSVKEAVLREEVAAWGDGAVSMAAGDGANDIPMLQAATYGVAYHAKPKARATANGTVDRGDLTSILLLLGIAPEKWLTG